MKLHETACVNTLQCSTNIQKSIENKMFKPKNTELKGSFKTVLIIVCIKHNMVWSVWKRIY